MTENPRASDWAAERGDKWRTNLAGMEATLRPVDEPLIDALQLDAAYRIADVGCGGGGTTLDILRRAPPGSSVRGFDISPGLIEVARGRVGPEDGDVAFAVADVATATTAEPYQRLASRFGTMFYSDPPAAFANLARWLVPGGRFAFAVWGPQPANPWMTTVRDVAAELIALPPVDPDAPGPFRYAAVDKLLALLTPAGLAGLEVRDWCGPLAVGGGLPPAEAARFALAAFSNFGELLAAAGADALDQAQRSLAARLARHERDGAVQIDACVHIVTGTRAPR